MDAKLYLDYLDKEMTIMGILSAFCVAVPAGILNAVVSKDGQVAILFWNSAQLLIVMGSVFFIVAASLFYKERSTLAWYHGQISLTATLNSGTTADVDLRKWLREADSWATWWPYSWAFDFLLVGFAEYLAALLCPMAMKHWPWFVLHAQLTKLYYAFAVVAIALICAGFQWYVLTHYKFSDDYWADYWADITEPFRVKMRPDIGVYTRLKPSKIHGVGVFAIIDIPKYTYMFEPDDDSLVSISTSEIENLSAEIKQLYQDFCVLREGVYECPSNLNRLTPAWFLNDSKNPNVAADSDLKFYALRDIEAGEELTSDYETYSE